MAGCGSSGKKKTTSWMTHVKKVSKQNKGMSLKQILVKAKATYKK